MIQPPSNVRESIDKTVGYVLKNGSSFEDRLKLNNVNNQFDFLNPDHQYHEYYQWKLNNKDNQDTQHETITIPSQLKYLIDLPIISQYDLNVIKATALYVVENGGLSIIPKLKSHVKSQMAQFEFLNSNHSLYKVFINYTDQYKSVIDIFTQPNNRERVDITDQNIDVLENAINRSKYINQNKSKVKLEKKQQEDKQIHFASIDWQDFNLVAKIEFDQVDLVQELSVPLKRDDLLSRSLVSKAKELDLPKMKVEPKKQEQTELADLPPPAPFKGMKIKAAGSSRLKKSTAQNTIKCPITNKLVPEADFDNHLKVLLRDPRYKQEQENYIKKNFSYSSNITTDQVYENIKRLVKKRHINEDEQDRKRQTT